jgi:dTDP-4-dehydrorhamnose 3,5-epimerase
VHVSLLPGLVTQWHCHHVQRDIVCPVRGFLRIALYDARQDSPTQGKCFAMNFNLHRPRYLHIPPGVWHALKNVGTDEAVYIVLNDVPFDYESPDDWTLAQDSPALPSGLL